MHDHSPTKPTNLSEADLTRPSWPGRDDSGRLDPWPSWPGFIWRDRAEKDGTKKKKKKKKKKKTEPKFDHPGKAFISFMELNEFCQAYK